MKMNNQIKEIAEKFLAEEKIPTKTALLMASLGLNKSAGDIADIAYGVNFSQHAYGAERQQQMVEFLGYAMLNWQILALTTGLSTDEIAKRFSAEWLTKHTGKASIKDLLKHLKPNARVMENAVHEKIANDIVAATNVPKQPNQTVTTETVQNDFARQL